MKKIIGLLLVTAIALFGIVQWGYQRKPKVVVLRTVTLASSSLQETVTCKGKVEETDGTTVQVQTDCVAKEVLVEKGQQVKKGDTLFSIDKEATLTMLAKADGVQAVQYAMQDALEERITAPCDGVVDELSVRSGDTISSDQVCVVIQSVQPVQIRLSVPERHIARVKKGQSVLVTGVGFSGGKYNGYISEIAHEASLENSAATTEVTVQAVVTLEHSDDSLRVGLTANGTITVSVVSDGFLLPYEAVCADANGEEFVYVLNGEAAEKRECKPLAELQDGYLVTETFRDGDVIITEPSKIVQNAIYRAEEIA